jgi:DNA-binding response OmpR family regulator
MQRQDIDVVVVDVDLPKMGGYRMLQRMSERWPDVPVWWRPSTQ